VAKRLITEADVRAMARGAELALGQSAIATPAALDVAFERGIRVVWSDKSATPGAVAHADVFAKMLASDGTYVVQVENGRALVTRLAPSGPEAFGSTSKS
jgi:hypothetical protein